MRPNEGYIFHLVVYRGRTMYIQAQRSQLVIQFFNLLFNSLQDVSSEDSGRVMTKVRLWLSVSVIALPDAWFSEIRSLVAALTHYYADGLVVRWGPD